MNSDLRNRIELIIRQTARQYPHAIALTEWSGAIWKEMTYESLIDQAERFSEKLCSYQIKPGSRVILLSHNRIQAMIALLGIWFAQATAVLIDPDLPESVLLQQIEVADACFLVFENEKQKSFLDKITSPAFSLIEEDDFSFYEKNTVLSKSVDQDCSSDIATLIFTSGTTGSYKAVVLTHHHYLYLTQFYNQLSDQAGCSLTVLPFFHVAGLFCGFLQPLILGVRVIFFRFFSAAALQAAFSFYHPNVLITVPRLLEVFDQKIMQTIVEKGWLSKIVFYMLLQLAYLFHRYAHWNVGKIIFRNMHQKFGGKLKKILCGSAQLSPMLQKRFLSLGFDLYCSYGLTETCGPITFTQYGYRWKQGSVGPAVEKKDLSISSEGEILYAGPAVMSGYFRDEQSTRKAIYDGFFHTRDLGKTDRFGNLYIIGRMKELIVFSDGKKIMPEQMEAEYKNIPGISELAIFGVQHQKALIAVLAFVPSIPTEANALTQKIFQQASRLKSPYRISDVLVVADLPRSSTLKVKRHELVDRFLAEKKGYQKRMTDHSLDAPELEAIIACFQSVLPDKKAWISKESTFAELGIDSLLAAQLAQEITQKTGIAINPTVFWFAQSIKKLQQQLQMEQKLMPSSVLRRSTNIREKIAIVAMDAAFPGAQDNETFWKNLVAGKDAIIEIPSSRFNIDDYYDPYPLAPGKTHSRFGGFIELPENFPCDAFGLKPRVANAMDPQQKIVLMQTKRMLEKLSGAQGLEKWRGSKTGVFLGGGFSDFMIQLIKALPLEKINPYSGIGMADFSLVGRVAYHFGLEGPAMLIKTACSSSLVAVHQAMRALQTHDCDQAIAGGINFILVPEINVCLTKGGFLSAEGRCKTFDASANGYVRSEGCGLVLLKRYEDALNEGDPILAVIMSSAINQDGASNGLTAPNGHSQIKCYQAALEKAAIRPQDIHFLESHGSGTQLGDAIEMQSIQAVYDQQRHVSNKLYVGAVKSVIGHCEASAGIAGLIKTVGVLNHQIVPPNLHYHHPNPNISFEQSNVHLPTKAIDLKNTCDYAAVSSFGVAGTNVHMILERYKQ